MAGTFNEKDFQLTTFQHIVCWTLSRVSDVALTAIHMLMMPLMMLLRLFDLSMPKRIKGVHCVFHPKFGYTDVLSVEDGKEKMTLILIPGKLGIATLTHR